MSTRPSRIPGVVADVALRVLSVGGLLVLAFLAGSWLTYKDFFPYRDHLRKAFLGADAMIESSKPTEGQGARPDPLLKAGDKGPTGTRILLSDRVQSGPTLIATGQGAHLIDFDGTVLHSWGLDYETIAAGGPPKHKMRRVTRYHWRSARVLSGGDLLVVIQGWPITPYGLALVRLDRDSRPRFVSRGQPHHDLDVGPDGKIYTLGHVIAQEPPARLKSWQGPIIGERLYVLSPDGRTLRDISIIKAFLDSPYRKTIEWTTRFARYRRGDYLHSNNVDVVTPEIAARFDFAREGQVLLSFREPNLLAVMDLEEERIVWARTGPWFRQHDPDFLDNGNLLIFDNRGDWDRMAGSRVIEYDPRSGAIVWEFDGEGAYELRSSIQGDSQRLANGNTLVNSYMQGVVLEVAPDGEVVWLYRCSTPGDEEKGCLAEYAQRLDHGEIDFPLNGGSVPETSGNPASADPSR